MLWKNLVGLFYFLALLQQFFVKSQRLFGFWKKIALIQRSFILAPMRSFYFLDSRQYQVKNWLFSQVQRGNS
jgi:hypothetical protein